MLSPADAARVLGVTEADVMATIESGELKAKKIGSAWPDHPRGLGRIPQALMPGMAEISALQKNACPECGGDMVWDPAKQTLACPYCGTVVPGAMKEDGCGVVEHDLAEALRNVPADQRGWQEQKITVKCRSCQAISVFDPGRAAQRCDFCGSPEIVPYEETRDPIRPESVLPFKLTETQVRDGFRTLVRQSLVRAEPA